MLSRAYGLLPALVLVSCLPLCVWAGPIMDSVNASATPWGASWYADEVGWYYTPSFGYTLGGIETKFGSSDGRTVTVQFWSAHPEDGGVVLASGGFIPVANAFAGADFGSVALTAGHTYFVGFQNTTWLVENVTADPGATMWSPVRWSGPPYNGTYSLSEADYFTSQPIILFEGPEGAAIPEPASAILLASGLAGLAFASRRRFARPR